MKKYKIAIVGLGSIGRRHILNIFEVLNTKKIAFSIDVIRRNKNSNVDSDLQNYISNIYSEKDNIDNDYDVIFITNPTFLHFSSIKKYAKHTKNMFIEKPIFEKTEYDISDLDLDEGGTYYIACPLRYTRVLQYVKKNIDLSEVYSARVISSSYLPNWRPNTDYRQSYSANQIMGGGVSLDLIHEWDYIKYLFGKPEHVYNFRGKFSSLDISSEDISIYIARYRDKLVELHLDYFGEKDIRQLQLFTCNDTIEVDFLNNTIKYLSEGKVIEFDDDRNSYQLREIENFFNIVEGFAINENTIDDAYETVKIAID